MLASVMVLVPALAQALMLATVVAPARESASWSVRESVS